MQRKPRAARERSAQVRKQPTLTEKVEKLERKVSKTDSFHLWCRNNNMKQQVVTLHDVQLLQYPTVGGASTFTNPITLDPNYFSYNSGAAFVGRVPQKDIWNQYAEMYEYWMVEEITLEFIPARLQVETTGTGTQDTCVWPTVAAKDSDTLQTFWSPATSFATAQNQCSALACKKGFKVAEPFARCRLHSAVANTLLMKQEAPMLRTNGSVAAREEYSNEAGSLVMLPARNPADRSLMGTCIFSIKYRFAGVHQPGVAIPKQIKDPEDQVKIAAQAQQIESLTNLLSTLSVQQSTKT